MDFIYDNILKPVLKIFENFFNSKKRKEFVIIFTLLDNFYHKGGNFLNNIIFMILFPILFFPLINFSFLIVGGLIITIIDILFSILPLIKKGVLEAFINDYYVIEILCGFWNLFLLGHYIFSGMLKVRYKQTIKFFKYPFVIAYKIEEYDLAYDKSRKLDN